MTDASNRSTKAETPKKSGGTSPTEDWMSPMRAMLKEEHSVLLGKVRAEAHEEISQFKQELNLAVQRWDAGMEKIEALTTRVCAVEQDVSVIGKAVAQSLSRTKPTPHGKDVFGGLTVAQMFLLSPQPARATLKHSSSLGDLAACLTASGRTAAPVTDNDGNVIGLLTENDVMRAYFEGSSPDRKLGDWLTSSLSRAPGQVLPKLTVRPSAPLVEVAQKMVANAIAGDCASHHVLVQEDGQLYGVLSAHDVVTTLCRPEMWDHRHLVEQVGPDTEILQGPTGDAVKAAASKVVADVMKPLEQVFTCKPGDTMKDALKVLLMTQQNSTVVADADGIYGIITPRDAVKAFLDGVTTDVSVALWLRSLPTGLSNRTIASNLGLIEVAAEMTDRDVNHLVVVRPGTLTAIGVVSSLDLVLRTRVNKPSAQPSPEGPTLGELVTQPIVCKKGTTLGAAAKMLATCRATSVVVLFDGEDPDKELLTEDDIVRAYVRGGPQEEKRAVEAVLAQQQEAVTLFMQPSMPLMDAASFMLCASEPGRRCHHVVVMDSMTQEWLGIFSALDFARALLRLRSELDVAKTGADQTTVSAVMKPRRSVPTCNSSDTIHNALSALIASGQNAAFVVGTNGNHDLITSRCAVQAIAEGVSQDRSVTSWLNSRGDLDGSRGVPPNMHLLQAAKIMTEESLHHLVVQEHAGALPLGVLSALDLARGISSIRVHCPFVSLAWLRSVEGPKSCTLQAA